MLETAGKQVQLLFLGGFVEKSFAYVYARIILAKMKMKHQKLEK